jgi:hypothetical protein
MTPLSTESRSLGGRTISLRDKGIVHGTHCDSVPQLGRWWDTTRLAEKWDTTGLFFR